MPNLYLEMKFYKSSFKLSLIRKTGDDKSDALHSVGANMCRKYVQSVKERHVFRKVHFRMQNEKKCFFFGKLLKFSWYLRLILHAKVGQIMPLACIFSVNTIYCPTVENGDNKLLWMTHKLLCIVHVHWCISCSIKKHFCMR